MFHKRIAAASLLLPFVLIAAACGGDDGGTTAATPTTAKAAVTTTAAATATTTAAATPTTAAATPTTTAAAATTTAAASTAAVCAKATAPAAGATAVDVSLIEWEVKMPTTLKAGDVAINLKNAANGDHELVIIKGDFASLPKQANGAVDEKALPAGALVQPEIGLRGNQSCTLGVNLPAGKYTFLCNISSGPNSHAAKGQKIDVTVA